MKKTFAMGLVALFLTGCGGGGEGTASGGIAGYGNTVQAEPTPGQQPESVCTLDLFGDSILAGQNMSGILQQTPAARIKALRPKLKVTDHAQAGQTASGAAQLFPSAVQARIVVLEHGTNDMIMGMPVEEPLTSMAQRTKSDGRLLVMTGMSKSNYDRWTEYSAKVKGVAQKQDAKYAGWDEVEVKTVDGTHPDQDSTNRLVDKLLEQIDKVAPDCK